MAKATAMAATAKKTVTNGITFGRSKVMMLSFPGLYICRIYKCRRTSARGRVVSCVTCDPPGRRAMTIPQIPFTPRQQQLLAAAARVVARSGLRGLTHRAVDAEAGLPEGSCSAYMRTRVALLTRLTEYVTSQFARDIADCTH